MMTMEQQYELFARLPKELHDKYGFGKPFDYSKYECIHKDGFDYYPELDCVLINTIPVVWETGTDDLCEVDINNPAHLDELMRRAGKRLSPELVGIIRMKENGDMTCLMRWHKPEYPCSRIPVDGTYLYYESNDIDLANDGQMRLLAESMFIAKRYNTIHVIPYKGVDPGYWEGGL